ncbi:FecR family protein [Maribacter halichondriae]|uniref:FecR family protein n=1 Tax=Maribacter halichondriae TaxID=2980554 RepID=UPI0023595B56|nr:FecR domain-containing protein [Maribacter sp. Hal144]
MDKEYLIQKWLTDALSEQEMEAFKQLDDYPELTGIIENASYFKASGFSTVDDFETFSTRLEKDTAPVRKLNWIKPFLRIASVFVIGLALSYFFLFNRDVEINTLAGEKTTIELPDASTVVVNALSKISYSKSNWDDKREVELRGEAFFKVAKGAKFDVVTSEGTVSVVGTQFNVKQRGSYFEVECFEGIVKVTSPNATEQITAGDRFRFSNGKASLEKTTYQNPQWTRNVSSFERVPLSEVISELERQYNIKVQMVNISTDQLFTGGFVHDSLENALKSISEPLDLEYRIENGNSVSIYPLNK